MVSHEHILMSLTTLYHGLIVKKFKCFQRKEDIQILRHLLWQKLLHYIDNFACCDLAMTQDYFSAKYPGNIGCIKRSSWKFQWGRTKWWNQKQSNRGLGRFKDDRSQWRKHQQPLCEFFRFKDTLRDFTTKFFQKSDVKWGPLSHYHVFL